MPAPSRRCCCSLTLLIEALREPSHSDAACTWAVRALAASLGPALQRLVLADMLLSAALVQRQQQLTGLRDLDSRNSLTRDSIGAAARAGWALERIAI